MRQASQKKDKPLNESHRMIKTSLKRVTKSHALVQKS